MTKTPAPDLIPNRLALKNGTLKAEGNLLRTDIVHFRSCCQSLCESPRRAIYLDLTLCSHMGSMFISELAETVMRMKELGKEVHVEVSPQLGKMLHMARMFQLFEYEISSALVE